MGRKKGFSLKKNLKIYFGYLLFKLWTSWARQLSLKSLGPYGEKIGILAFYLSRKRRRVALNNLYLALGREKSEEEIREIHRESFKNIGRDMMEITRSLDYEDHYLKTLIRLEGKEHLDHALQEGKGVIALTAHFGNFPLMGARLVKEGYPLSLVIREQENPKIAKVITSFRDAIGMESIPDKPRMTCVARCLKALKGNRVLMIQIDRNAPVTETWVDFFGYLVPTFKGPVVFSLRTGAAIIPIFIVRNPGHHHKVIIHSPFRLNITGAIQQDITSNIARLTKIVEAIIRAHPEQWWWIYRRFKKARNIKTGERLFPKDP